MLTLATYVSMLEADKQKLKAQVKRLCAENNWLRKELTEHQQLLQETEISLAKVKEEKEHLGFLLEQQRVCQCSCVVCSSNSHPNCPVDH